MPVIFLILAPSLGGSSSGGRYLAGLKVTAATTGRFSQLAHARIHNWGEPECQASPGTRHLGVRPEGFEPPTLGLEVRCSIQLSYGRL
jgi:hypothetical protein